MSKSRSGVLLNLAVVLGSLVLAVLLYAFVARNWDGEVAPLRTAAPIGIKGGAYQVEIRNGCGTGGLARDARDYLRDRGFDVVESGNYSDFEQPLSRVVDRAGNLEAAYQLARAFGISEELVTQEVSPDVYLDATVVIGHDYAELPPFRKTAGR